MTAITHFSAIKTGQMGSVTLDGTNPTSVTFPQFDVLEGAVLGLAGDSSPALGTSILTYALSGNTLSIYAWQVTASGDATLVASEGTETVSYVVWGS